MKKYRNSSQPLRVLTDFAVSAKSWTELLLFFGMFYVVTNIYPDLEKRPTNPAVKKQPQKDWTLPYHYSILLPLLCNPFLRFIHISLIIVRGTIKFPTSVLSN